MITRQHIGLGLGSMAVLYFPLFFVHPFSIAAVSAGVCTGVLLPDVHMKKPTRSKGRYALWLIIQLFKATAVRLYLAVCRYLFDVHTGDNDKRLTHSVPGLLYLTALISSMIFAIELAFPAGPAVSLVKMALAGFIIGLLFHFLEDICTKKGMYPFYPFSDAFQVSGCIRPCNKDDPRIRLFHVLFAAVTAGIFLLYTCGLCPGYLEWPLSIGAFSACTLLMICHAEVKVTFHMETGDSQTKHDKDGNPAV